MAIVKELAQVLRIHEQGNTSLVVVLLGRRLGQFRIHAKGARRWPKKGFEGGFDLLTRGEMVLYPRSHEGLWIYKEWDEHARPALGRSPESLLCASYLCELSEALTRETAGAITDPSDANSNGESNARIYDELARSADALAGGALPGPVLLHFTLMALNSEGLLPDLSVCSQCGRPLTQVLSTLKGASPHERSQQSAKRIPSILTVEGGRAPPLASDGVGGQPSPTRMQAAWFTGRGAFCRACAVELAKERSLERGIWLSPEAQRALVHWSRSDRNLRVSPAAAAQLARAMMLLVHAGLEHDLHTLRRAVQSVAAMNSTVKKGPPSTERRANAEG